MLSIKGEWDAFSFRVSGRDRGFDLGPFLDIWDGDIDFGMSTHDTLWATWTYSKRAVLFGTHASGLQPKSRPRALVDLRVASRVPQRTTR